MHRNPSARVHDFSMIPQGHIPRSSFSMEWPVKTCFDSGYLIPVLCEEILPGDSVSGNMTGFIRLATPLVPVMDNLYADLHVFFVPLRLTWTNFKKFMGEQDNPADSISFTIPQITSPAGGFVVGSIADYFGIPPVGQITAGLTIAVNALPFRAYALIWNAWFRDENMQNSVAVSLADGPDVTTGATTPLRRGKRHDIFTAALPWTQKGGVAVTLPLSGSAPIRGLGINAATSPTVGVVNVDETSRGNINYASTWKSSVVNTLVAEADPVSNSTAIYADLSAATASTINAIRQAVTIQQLLERDARGGTRYTEKVRSHFGVTSPDARLQRPEYLGGGSTRIVVNPIAQTSATGLTGGATPVGNLAAMGTGLLHGGFKQSFTEHGYLIGVVSVRADLSYQQGLRKHWSRLTQQDYYWPTFANLGEQAILNREIYCKGDANDILAFGYQERYAEYRYPMAQITSLMRSTSAGTLDIWHLSQKFTALPTLNATFIQDTPPVARILAVASVGKEFLCDILWKLKMARPMPMYSVPGLLRF